MRAIFLPSCRPLMARFRKGEPKVASSIRPRIRPDCTSLSFHRLASNRQTKARSGFAGVRAPERQEDGLELLFGQPLAAVANMDPELGRMIFDRNFDSAPIGELDRIV